MQIYDVLKKDHQTVLHLLEQMENTSDSAVQKRRDLLARLTDEIVPHMRAEEKVLYDTLKEINETEELVLEAEEEHSTCEMVLRDLETMEPSDKHWAAKLAVLKENLELHIEEEETEIFTQAKQVLAPEEAKMMADAFKNLKAEVKEGGILESALNSVAKLMPPRFSKRFTEISRRLT